MGFSLRLDVKFEGGVGVVLVKTGRAGVVACRWMLFKGWGGC